MTMPHYWTQATKHLAANCPTMATLIARYAGEGLRARGDGFYTLVRAVVGQQISVKAADAVWARLAKAVTPMTPENLLRKRENTLRNCGLSASKEVYLRNVARFFVERRLLNSPLEGELNPSSDLVGGKDRKRMQTVTTDGDAPSPHQTAEGAVWLPREGGAKKGLTATEAAYWAHHSDAEVIAELTAIKGIGSWTAEMFLIFCLTRPDVLPLKDLGLLKAIDLHYTGGKRLTLKEYEALSARWKPYRTVATWYLWRALDPVPVEY